MRAQDQDQVVASISLKTGFPVEVAKECYLAALLELSADARVHIYLSLFAAKRAVAMLRQESFEWKNQSSPDPEATRIDSRVAPAAAPDDGVSFPPRKQPHANIAPQAFIGY
ncbi:DUF3562 domain-containing protein (plasmid) [Cupriavidus sp. P-10]|uniref:DUF3562 domain-containing protein n=1 Tax=Cupriavidus sp. P-10 TaxID=2027911 RepID=UPI000E2EADDC|nr:DUF3562 domain-containing protein [Cupriavidus sp. P-10]BDB29282.1 DUF3562 domain-containing protein [Cupriavidus sp. P-10]